jgi:hypothetical protein
MPQLASPETRGAGATVTLVVLSHGVLLTIVLAPLRVRALAREERAAYFEAAPRALATATSRR